MILYNIKSCNNCTLYIYKITTDTEEYNIYYLCIPVPPLSFTGWYTYCKYDFQLTTLSRTSLARCCRTLVATRAPVFTHFINTGQAHVFTHICYILFKYKLLCLHTSETRNLLHTSETRNLSFLK